jgi:hypothetical protein
VETGCGGSADGIVTENTSLVSSSRTSQTRCMPFDGLHASCFHDQLSDHLKLASGRQRSLCIPPPRHTCAHHRMGGGVLIAEIAFHDFLNMSHGRQRATAPSATHHFHHFPRLTSLCSRKAVPPSGLRFHPSFVWRSSRISHPGFARTAFGLTLPRLGRRGRDTGKASTRWVRRAGASESKLRSDAPFAPLPTGLVHPSSFSAP